MIPYGRQDITQSDVDAVVEILRSDFLTQGPAVPRFEEAIRSRVNVRHAVAVNSATSALHLACLALDLRHGGTAVAIAAEVVRLRGAKDPTAMQAMAVAMRVACEPEQRAAWAAKLVTLAKAELASRSTP